MTSQDIFWMAALYAGYNLYLCIPRRWRSRGQVMGYTVVKFLAALLGFAVLQIALPHISVLAFAAAAVVWMLVGYKAACIWVRPRCVEAIVDALEDRSDQAGLFDVPLRVLGTTVDGFPFAVRPLGRPALGSHILVNCLESRITGDRWKFEHTAHRRKGETPPP
ncbi:MAG TPA: hypothetical protein VJJ47_03605 [Candidatus Paceibacterota bacterium]